MAEIVVTIAEVEAAMAAVVRKLCFSLSASPVSQNAALAMEPSRQHTKPKTGAAPQRERDFEKRSAQ